MPDGRQDRWVSVMRWTGRILASVAASWFLAIFIGEAVTCDPGPFTWDGATVVAVGLAAIAGAVLSWVRLRHGAIVLLVTSVLIGIHIAIFAGRMHVQVWFALGFPYLVAGLLLLGSVRLSASQSENP